MNPSESPYGLRDRAQPPVSVNMDQDYDQGNPRQFSTNKPSAFSPQLSTEESFLDNYAEDSSHMQNTSFVRPEASTPNIPQEEVPLFSSLQPKFKPSQSMGGMTAFSEDQGNEMHGAYSTNSLNDRRYNNPSDSSHQAPPQDPYPWMTMSDVKEADDDLHDPTKKTRTHGAPQRALLNVGTLILLTLALLMLFAGYPILHHYTEGQQQDSRIARLYNLQGNKMPQNSSNLLTNRLNATRPAGFNQDFAMFVDPATPANAYTLNSTYSRNKQADGFGKTFRLVFSDEFNQDGRTFYPGEDPFWEAVDLHYWATNNYEWYDPAAVYTKDGSLRIRLEQHQEHNLNFRGGMLQSWNKFCFRGGILIASVQLPGFSNVPGLWPAFWLMGNLGRAGYGSTLQGTWPYSYDTCDVGTVMNQTLYNDDHPNGFPADTLNGGATMFNQKHNTRALSFLPGQKLSACTCQGEDHPGPWLKDENRYRGRAAPEIDVFEAQPTTNGGMQVSQSCQMAPYNWMYDIDTGATQNTYSFYDNPDGINIYTGEITQQSLSGVNKASQYAVQLTAKNQIPQGQPNGDSNFATYSVELKPGSDGYAAWTSAGKPAWELYPEALRADERVKISARQFPAEPMYIIFNLGVSSNFGSVDWKKLGEGWPFEMAVDWVRVYQDPDAYDVGCDTEDYPTKDYIDRHIEAYTNPNLTIWGYTPKEGGYQSPWPKNKLYSKGCGTTANRMYPGDPDQAEVLAPNISSKSVTLGVYSRVEASTGGRVQTITKTTPNPTELGATDIHRATSTAGLHRRSSAPEHPTEASDSQ
ncbi:hypothetical protein MYAM1_000489 [Malassezia yamatoensis]|uniref:GH16 domain-containing protein n=1 Tax=Malassezia yamatoensis TaxID=253288 RepID=A0AAJ5YPE0_9BASI|nr:hypothetical protein MYAM1_000489 [Malassezia yamatoensis]